MRLSRKELKKGIDVMLDGGLEGKFVFNTLDCIGKGNFGKIYRGRNIHTFELVAIKTEPINSLQLIHETQAYAALGVKKRNHGIRGLPEIYYMNNIGLQFMALAMEMLGPTLNELLIRCGKRFSLKTTLMIAMQMMNRIEHVHSCKVIHRDIKPENILIGRPLQTLPYKPSAEDTIYLIDFGVAKTYYESETDERVVRFAEGAAVVGTYMFMSARCHLNIEQSRRDDLESLGYVLLYLINGTLPWGIYLKKPVDLKTCGQLKNKISLEDLCDGLPEEFVKYFNHIRQLEKNEKPDYEMLYNLFDSCYTRLKFISDNLFDWSNLIS